MLSGSCAPALFSAASGILVSMRQALRRSAMAELCANSSLPREATGERIKQDIAACKARCGPRPAGTAWLVSSQRVIPRAAWPRPRVSFSWDKRGIARVSNVSHRTANVLASGPARSRSLAAAISCRWPVRSEAGGSHAGGAPARHPHRTRLWERVAHTLLAEKDLDGAEVLLRSGLALSAATPKARLPALMGNRQDAHAGFAGVVNDAVGKPLQGKATELSSPSCAKVWLLREKCCRSLELRDEGTPQIRVCRSRVIQTALHKILFRLRREGNPHESAWRAR